MTTDVDSARSVVPTREELLAAFGEDYLSIQALFRFCFVPNGRLGLLKDLTLDEDWAANNFVLLKYLAVHLRLGIEQGRYVWNGDQIVLTAGRLSTRGGAPIYVGLVRNASPQENPWVLNWVGERPSTPDLPEPASLGEWPPIDPASEIVLSFDPADPDRKVRLPHVGDAPAALQAATVVGGVHWALHRGLVARQIHGGGRGYFVPLFLTQRDDLGTAPDLVCPIVAQSERLVVRAVLEPNVAYAPARAVVERPEQLPNWLLDAWESAGDEGEGEL
jgi:hypothetical protein